LYLNNSLRLPLSSVPIAYFCRKFSATSWI
jgi:hypothetical protein